jgi:peptidoglycan/LPS O-acetylase OafA/YrhL
MKLREIERLRAVAALLVVSVHWWPLHNLFPVVLRDAWSGVDLFFVISGYVVSLSLLRMLKTVDSRPTFLEAVDIARTSITTFYVRRFFRIMPAALVVALGIGALARVFPAQFGTPSDWFQEFVAFFGGIYNYAFGGSKTAHMGVYWSLAVEEHFYLVLPVLFLLFRTPQRRLAASAVVVVFSVACRTMLHPDAKPGDEYIGSMYYSHNRFDSLMAGVALALVSSHFKGAVVPKMPPWVLRWAILPAAIALIACLPGTAPKNVTTQAGFVALWMLGGLLVAYASMDRGYVLDVPVLRRILEYVGARSYALYLVHQSVFRLEQAVRSIWPVYDRLAPDSDRPWMRLVVLSAATWLVVEALYNAVEKPMIAIGRRLLAAESPPAMSRPWKRSFEKSM